jgi:hypothetical protein
MQPGTALVFRLSGLLIEFVCAALFVTTRGKGIKVAGQPVEYLLLAGFVVGFAIWLASMTLVRRVRPKRSEPREPGWLAAPPSTADETRAGDG